MSTPGPTLGPCESWITGDDVSDCCQEAVASSDDQASLEARAIEGSMLMYELSGRMFSGICGPVKVRPCRRACGCWGSASSGLGPWALSPTGDWWTSECSEDSCGCGSTSYVRLAGYPVREVSEVKIDGAVLDPSEYRLEGWRKLMRTTDPGPPAQTRRWPACQDLGLEDDQTGTFSISYTHGVDPPELGRTAAAQLACELYAACRSGDCKLPNNVVQIVRQGITMDRVTPLAAYLRSGSTGLPAVDAFLAAYNPDGLRRRPLVWSPDQQQFARREAV